MKIDAVVLRETRFVSVGTLFFSALLQLVFMAFGAWEISVLLGTVYSGAVGVLNFLLLGMTVQRALGMGDPEQAKAMMKLSRTVRMLGQLAALAVGVLLDVFSTVAVLVAIFFPRLTLVVRGVIIARRGADASGAAVPPARETDEGGAETEDENQ